MCDNNYWLASYPKSGNTWLRILLTNYLRDGDEPADINNLDGGPIASARLPQSTASFFRRGKANSWQFDRDMLKVTDTSEVPVTLPSSLICFQLRDDVFALALHSATSHQGSAHGTISFSPCPSR